MGSTSAAFDVKFTDAMYPSFILTDPVLASSVIGKASKFATENVPEHLRNLLSGKIVRQKP